MPKQIRKPADPGSGPLATFGFELRTLRQQAGLSYSAIAEKSFFSKSAVHAVDQGHQLPSATILEAFVAACGAKPQPWLDRRARLALEQAASRDAAPDKASLREQGLPPPAPASVTTPGEFNDGLKRLREWSGMTYRQIEELSTAGGVRVAPSTLCGAFTRGTLPRRPLAAGFLKVIGLPHGDQQAWLAAWQAIKDGQPAPAAAAVLPTHGGWRLEVPAGEAFESDVETFRAALISRDSDSDNDGSTQDGWVIPTYLPAREIRDWRYQEGYWQDVEPALPEPPHRAKTFTSRIGMFATDHPKLALLLLLAGASLAAAVLIIVMIMTLG
jgi:transcriptional regulator with XRE-family HTH domain